MRTKNISNPAVITACCFLAGTLFFPAHVDGKMRRDEMKGEKCGQKYKEEKQLYDQGDRHELMRFRYAGDTAGLRPRS